MVKITGDQRHEARLRAMTKATALVGKALFAAGDMIKAEAQRSITAGAISGKGHVPSKPGEPPNADTHALDRQIENQLVEPLKVQVSSNAPHGLVLEVGSSKMAERPYMGPALAKKRREAVDLVSRAVQQANRMVT